MNIQKQSAEFDAWNPGLESELPREYLPLSTMFRSENVSTSVVKAHELNDYCGLPIYDLVAFRADRLIVHELLIWVTVNISVPDGTNYGDLGANFRAIVSTIHNKYIAPNREELARAFERFKKNAAAKITLELSNLFSLDSKSVAGADNVGRWGLPFNLGKPKKPPASSLWAAEQRERRTVAGWQEKSETADNRFDACCFRALSAIATAVLGRRGRLFGDKDLLTELAVTLVCNDYGSEVIGDAIEPLLQNAASQEGYRRLAAQKNPVVMNVKGASAAGKSSMRPRQRTLAKTLALPWEEFALISPDIWRKYLLDYGSLGAAYKYAGTMTGHELEIIDKKLDQRMATRAVNGKMTHLLIDRFRFDSFVPMLEGKGSTKLLTRFGDLVYMFFMITPPEVTVERAWVRGLKVGRYKAVEDLLAHNVEAYTGMPELFFTWALTAGKRVHYEFLDNSVAEDCPPRTAAFGWNQEMTILSIKSMLDIDRFRKINIHAQKPGEVYASDKLTPTRNVEFLKRCARLIPIVNFADYATGQVYARLEYGTWVWRDQQRFAEALADPVSKVALETIAKNDYDPTIGTRIAAVDLDAAQVHTLGAWGETAKLA
jgi:hypothetical protein